MSSKAVNRASVLSVVLAGQDIKREYKLESVHRLFVLVMLADFERVHGYCSGMMLQRVVNRQSANVLIWLESSGYIERTGNWNKPRKLSPAGWQVVSAFAARCAAIEQEQREGKHRALPRKGMNGRTRAKRERATRTA